MSEYWRLFGKIAKALAGVDERKGGNKPAGKLFQKGQLFRHLSAGIKIRLYFLGGGFTHQFFYFRGLGLAHPRERAKSVAAVFRQFWRQFLVFL